MPKITSLKIQDSSYNQKTELRNLLLSTKKNASLRGYTLNFAYFLHSFQFEKFTQLEFSDLCKQLEIPYFLYISERKSIENEKDSLRNFYQKSASSFAHHFYNKFQPLQLSYLTSIENTIILIGRTGVGKSSIVNTLCKEPKAKVGIGLPVTNDFETFLIPSSCVQIMDTPGLELSNTAKMKQFYQNRITNIKKQNADILFLVLDATSPRILEEELWFIETSIKHKIIVKVIFTKCDCIKNEMNLLKITSIIFDRIKYFMNQDIIKIQNDENDLLFVGFACLEETFDNIRTNNFAFYRKWKFENAQKEIAKKSLSGNGQEKHRSESMCALI